MPRPKLRRSACRRKISAAPTVHSRPSRSRSSREIEPLRVRSFLEWPFFEPEHREIAERLDAWAESHLAHRTHAEDRASVDGACRALVRELGLAGWTRYSVPYAAPRAVPGLHAAAQFDVRALALVWSLGGVNSDDGHSARITVVECFQIGDDVFAVDAVEREDVEHDDFSLQRLRVGTSVEPAIGEMQHRIERYSRLRIGLRRESGETGAQC